MPLYKFVCACGEETEINCSVKERPLTLVHSCGGIMQRAITYPSMVIFRGPGFSVSGDHYEEGGQGVSTITPPAVHAPLEEYMQYEEAKKDRERAQKKRLRSRTAKLASL